MKKSQEPACMHFIGEQSLNWTDENYVTPPALSRHWQHIFMPDEAADRVGVGLAVIFNMKKLFKMSKK